MTYEKWEYALKNNVATHLGQRHGTLMLRNTVLEQQNHENYSLKVYRLIYAYMFISNKTLPAKISCQ